jgi:uncharacterized protein
MMTRIPPFHLAIPVNDIASAREFYTQVLNCQEGRSTEMWIDFDFYGHQLVVHLDPDHLGPGIANTVDGHSVPVPHFGVVLAWEVWQNLADKMKNAGTDFVIEPYIRFSGEVGEQATMFFLDPSGNALEFKAFKDIGQIFAK